MALEDVKAFYQRLSTDETFREKLQNVTSKEECSQTVKGEGYNFTQEELEAFTAKLIESEQNESELRDLDEKELEAVAGGAVGYLIAPFLFLMYGGPSLFFK